MCSFNRSCLIMDYCIKVKMFLSTLRHAIFFSSTASLCLPFILPLPLLYYNTTSYSIVGHHFKTVSQQHQIFVVTVNAFKNSRFCTVQQQLHTFWVLQSDCQLRAQTDELEGDIRNPDCKHKNSAAVCRFQSSFLIIVFLCFPFFKI